MAVTTLAPWFGSNRMLGEHVGKLLAGKSWVGVPFAGGMAELPHVAARTVLVNDLHRLVINLARVVADDELRPQLVHRLTTKAFHPDELALAQAWSKRAYAIMTNEDRLTAAEHYFVCCWMGRSGKAGTKDEFKGGVATRWNASGGDRVVRYHSAIANLEVFARTLKRCTFETMDAFDFLARCEDQETHGVYCDPPFPGPGDAYLFDCGKTYGEQFVWHERLRRAVGRFGRTKVVMRFHDHPMVTTLYGGWDCVKLEGRTQANKAAAELLLTKN